jgi:CPA1 family monovalent cation:H+ antiporter
VNSFDIAAVLLAVAATCGYVNHRFLRLPATTGTLAVALVSSFSVVVIEALTPATRLREPIHQFLQDIDFNQTLMRGLLSFLLFAGALHVDLGELLRSKWAVAALSTLGVLISTVVVGLLTWWTFGLAGIAIPLSAAMVFGALISPTDPVAVMGLLHELHAPASLEAQIAGESLFNDGVGVVVFLALLSLAAPSAAGDVHLVALGPAPLAVFFLREVAGGVLLGLVAGYAGYRAIKSIEDHPLELLITLALAMGVYAVAFPLGTSGPIAVVVSGLFIGNHGRRFAMSDKTRELLDAFWGLIDYVLNAVLFLLIALQIFDVPQGMAAVRAGLLAIPIVLAARAISVALPIAALRLRLGVGRGIVPILTWSGLRGGISVALVLSLPAIEGKAYLLAATYAVVVFSILVQGLTTRRLLVFYGVGATPPPR